MAGCGSWLDGAEWARAQRVVSDQPDEPDELDGRSAPGRRGLWLVMGVGWLLPVCGTVGSDQPDEPDESDEQSAPGRRGLWPVRWSWLDGTGWARAQTVGSDQPDESDELNRRSAPGRRGLWLAVGAGLVGLEDGRFLEEEAYGWLW